MKIIVNTIFLNNSNLFANILKERIGNSDSYSFQLFRNLNDTNECELEFESQCFSNVNECKEKLFEKLKLISDIE